MITTALIHLLLHLYYANISGIRHQLLALYRWQQPGMPASWYGPYVRSLIIHYPHAMSACMNALHAHRPFASLGRVCP